MVILSNKAVQNLPGRVIICRCISFWEKTSDQIVHKKLLITCALENYKQKEPDDVWNRWNRLPKYSV